ncbi:MAG TPA: NHL repeat-containing protein [Roseiflexaceae bacterium]|nr:NHL repeat-containing protein [Roseiflexaceae bacterium]
MIDTIAHQTREFQLPAALLVLGQATFTSSSYAGATHLFHPWSVAIDQATGAVFVADTDHHRVLRFSSLASLRAGASAEVALGQPDLTDATPAAGARGMRGPTGVALDGRGSLWVADTGNHRVLRFDNAARLPSGAPADTVLGQPDLVSTSPGTSPQGMRSPGGVVVDSQGNLWVADTDNHRMLRFEGAATLPDGAGAAGVLGQPDLVGGAPTGGAQGLSSPGGAAVDAEGNLWVADTGNHRVLRFDRAASLLDGAPASTVLGQPDVGSSAAATSAAGMSSPGAVAVDTAGRLWVADTGNHRVLRFDRATDLPSGTPAGAVLGQPSFTQRSLATTAQGLDTPSGLAADRQGCLWIVDQANHRVLRFDHAAGLPNGAPATGLIGHASFTTQRSISARAFDHPEAVAVDHASGKVFVADTRNHRVLRFADPSCLANGAPAEAVLGQPDLASNTPAAGRRGMRFPLGLAVDRHGCLWVADTGNHRVLRFDHAADLSSGAAAGAVLGQPDFGSSATASGACGMNRPSGVACDSGALWVADTFNNRVLRFDRVTDLPPGAPASATLGQPDFGRSAAVAGPGGMYRPRGLMVDPGGQLWVADSANNRVLRFDQAANLPSGAPASAALGQPDLLRNATASDTAGLHCPSAVAVDCDGRLWIADTFNSRLLCFVAPAHLSSGARADAVLGQPTPASNASAATAHSLHHPFGLAVDKDGQLWVADTFNNRVLLFAPKDMLL